MNRIYILIFFILLIIFVIVNYDFFRKLINSNIQIISWLKKNPDFKYYKDNIRKSSVAKYFYSLNNNQIHSYKMPLYEGVFINRNEDLNYTNLLYQKKNSLAKIINDFTTPNKFNGEWIGDSLFRTNYDERGPNNLLKEKYLLGLKPELLIIYRKRINNYLYKLQISNKNYNYYNWIRRIVIDITYLLHFNSYPSEKEINDFDIFIRAIAEMPKNYIYNLKVLKQIYNLKYFRLRFKKRLNELKNKKNDSCIIAEWIKTNSFTDEDIMIEFIHNLLGMGINWINTIYPYLLHIRDNTIPRLNLNQNEEYRLKYIYESFRLICPAMLASSNINHKNKNYQVIHDLLSPTRNSKYFGSNTNKFNLKRHNNYKDFLTNSKNKNNISCNKCPFYTTKNKEKVFNEQKIYINEGYSVFGKGYRRCPGEFISMIFLEEFAIFISPLKFNIKLKDGISKKISYIWDEIEMNYVIKFL